MAQVTRMTHRLTTTRLRSCLLVLVIVPLFLLLGAFGCSSASSSAGKCGAAQCAAGSACIDDGTGSAPRCQKVCTKQADCPFNWLCNDGQPQSWCVPSTIPLAKQPGQWGDLCLPSGGDANNPACDLADGFGCYGTSPTDANAMCTIFDCAQDSDCPGGWWCATVDVAPSVTTVNRSFGKTRAVCLPRQYCASCKMDHDCPPAGDGTQQHCMQDSGGSGFCSPQCATGSNCPLDATCNPMPWGVCAQSTCATDADCQPITGVEKCFGGICRAACASDAECPPSNGGQQHCGAARACVPQACASDDDCPPTRGTFQHCNAGTCTPECAADSDCNPATGDQACVPISTCMPRAGVCRGDGKLCAPCRSDADCSDGYCLNAAYSTERFCSEAVKSGTTCAGTTLPPGSCPMPPPGANHQAISCTRLADTFSPANQCIGAVTFGTAMGQIQYVPGCWTANR